MNCQVIVQLYCNFVAQLCELIKEVESGVLDLIKLFYFVNYGFDPSESCKIISTGF